MSNVLPGTLIERSFRERIILVGVIFPGLTEEKVGEELDELARLVDSAGADVVGRVVQRRNAPDAATFVGSGKAKEIAALSQTLDADTVVFDDDLTPAQHRNLEKLFGRTAIDRTAVILDIFAQNARSPEGKAQVELALLRYRLPRLRGRGSALSQQAGGIGTRGPGETQLEVDRRRLVRRMHKLEAELREVERTRTLQRQSRARGRHRELALVGYTNAGKSTLLNRLTDAGVPAQNRLFVTLDPRTRQLSLPGGETVLVTDTVGFVRKLPHELVEAFRSTLDSVRLADLIVHVVDSTAVDAEGQMAAVREVLAEIGASDVPDLIVVNKADAAPDEAKVLANANEGAVLISARTGEGVDVLLRVLGDRLRGSDRVVQLVVPWARGDVLAAIHREGEVVGQSDGEESATLAGGARRRRPGALRRIRGGAVTFRLPPYPYDRLAGLAKVAEAHEGGMVDCSIGTPNDPPLPAVIEALASSGTERGYPASAGSPQLREAAAAWLVRRFALEDAPALAACVGTKELVASVPHLLRLRTPDKDTVLYPAVSYPTYAMGADLAGCRAVPVAVPAGRAGGLDLDAIAPDDAARALLLWSNSPSNPTGGLGDLGAEAAWGRAHGVPVFSDECYTEFTWDGPPRSVLQHGSEGVVAVHSLSKRSNLAGVRVGFYAGDPELVEFLRAVRQHAGLMVPGPAQAAGVAALSDDEHVEAQRGRYRERLAFLAGVFGEYGCPVALPQGGFYLWVPVPAGRWPDAWVMAEALATDGGLLVSPGDLYGEDGAGHVRVAVVQPMGRLALVGERLARVRHG